MKCDGRFHPDDIINRSRDIQTAIQLILSNRFHPLQELHEDAETDIVRQWQHTKKPWHDTCE